MKKILSFVLLTALLLGCIAPALVVSAADTFEASLPATTTVVGNKKSVSVDLTIDEALDGAVEIDLVAWWPAGKLASLDFSGKTLNDYNVGTTRAATHKDVKNYLPEGYTAADVKGAVCTLEGAFATGDVITATITFDESWDYSANYPFAFVISDVLDADGESLPLPDDDSIYLKGEIAFAEDTGYTAAVAAAAEIGGPVFAVENVTVKPGTTSAQVRIFLLHNNVADFQNQQTDENYTGDPATGIWGTRTYLITPKTLTVHNDGAATPVITDYTVGDIFAGDQFKPGIANVAIDSNKDLTDAWNATYGEALAQADYNGTSVYFQSNATENNGTVLLNRYGDGMLLTVTIDLPSNARAGQVFPVKIAHWVGFTNKGAYGSDTSDGNNNLVFPTMLDGSITIESNGECGHNNTTWTTITASTCTVAGEEEEVCSDCLAQVSTRPLPLAPHTPGEAQGVVAATCTTAGYTGDVYCTVCENKITTGEATELAAHTPGQKTTTVAPQVGVEGAWEIRCTVCNTLVDSGVIAALIEAKISVDTVSSDVQKDIAVPVKIASNDGFWAIGGTIDLGGLTLKSIKKGTITLGSDNYSVNNGVLTFFYDNEAIKDITKNGTLFTLNFEPAAEGTYTLDLTITNYIDAEGTDKAFAVTDGAVTVSCQHVTEKVVTTPATIDAEGVLSTVCTKCKATLDTEAIAKLVGIVVANDVSAPRSADVAVPVSIVNNTGVWSVGATFAYDTTALTFVDVTSDVFAITAESYSVKDGVVTVFAENATLENYVGDGVIFTLNFYSAQDAAAEAYAIDAELVDGNTITADGADVAAGAVDGSIEITSVLNGIVNGYYYENGTLTGAGVVEIADKLYFVKNSGAVAYNEAVVVYTNKTNDLVTAGTYVADENGVITVANGVVDGYYYVNGIVNGAGVVKYNEKLYFANNDGSIAVSTNVTVYSTKTNGLVDAGVYAADADGVITALNGIVDGYYYANGVITGAGVVKIGDDLYFVKNNGAVAKDEKVTVYSTKTNGLVDAGEFTADANGVITGLNGIVDGYYYENGVITAAGVIKVEDSFYFVKNNGAVAKDEKVTVYSTKTNGLVTAGEFTADANGVLAKDTKNGIVDGYYYVQDVLTAAGVIEDGGKFYFVKNNGAIAKSEEIEIYSTKTNSLVAAGTYTADADGVITKTSATKNGIVNGYYYVDDVLTAAGVVEDGGKYYFVKNNGAVAKNENVEIYSTKTNSLVAAGTYTADADGVITKSAKNGIVNGYYYEDDVLKAAGVVKIGNDLYFVKNSGKVAKSEQVTVYSTKANGLIAPGTYTVDENGVIMAN